MKVSPLRVQHIRKLAREQLRVGNALQLPVDPIGFAKKHDILVQSFLPSQKDISGFLMQVGNNFGIGFSSRINSIGFQHFTVAHELGHYFIDGHVQAVLSDGKHLSRAGYIAKDQYEREADIFATEFLMPWSLVSPIANSQEGGLEAVRLIADRCQSSLLASAIRYTEISAESVAVILSNDGLIEFMVASDSFRQIPGIDWLRKSEEIPQDTLSSEKANSVEWIELANSESDDVDLSLWFPDLGNRILARECVIGLGDYGRLLTLLVAEYDPNSLEDDDESDDESDYIDRWREGCFRGRKS